MEQCEVKEGDTLVGLSLKYNVSVATLRRLNKLYGNEVYPGQILNLKSSSRSGKTVGTSYQQAVVQPPPPPTTEAVTINPPVEKNDISNNIIYDHFADFSISPSNGHERESRPRSASKLHHQSTTPTIFTRKAMWAPNPVKRQETHEDDEELKDPPVAECMSPPTLLGEGKVLTMDSAINLRRFLPPRLQIENWVLLYSVLNDGADLNSFFRKVKGRKYTVLIVETIKGEMFGGFNSVEWAVSPNFYGSGESFLFRIDSTTGNCERFKWTGDNEYFMWSSSDKIAMGGGGHGFGFVLDCDFATGESFCCATYGNSMLVNKEKGSFHIKNVECWGFESIFGTSESSKSNSMRSSGRASGSGKVPGFLSQMLS